MAPTQPLVVGGGVAGLMAALHLAERGMAPLLLEASPSALGGRLRGTPPVSFSHRGQAWTFRLEHGVHGIWSGYRNLVAALERAGALPTLIPAEEELWVLAEPGGRVRRAPVGSAIRRSYLPAPFHYVELLFNPRFVRMLGLRDLLALPHVMGSFLGFLSIDPLGEHKALAGLSLAGLTSRWSPRMRAFFAGLARNALAAHPEEITASGFIAFVRFYTLLRRDAWAFSYLPGPGDCAIDPLAARLRELGATIRLGVRATRLERAAAGWLVTCESAAGTEQIAADQVVLALDAPAASRLLAASPATAGRAAALDFPPGLPTAIVRLWFDRQPRRGPEAGILTGEFTADNFFWLDRLQPDFATWASQVGGSALELHVYGPPEQLDQPDGDLLTAVVLDAYRAFAELRGHLVHAAIQRNPATHTLFGVAAPDRHLAVVTPWAGLLACGDWVYHPHPALYLERAAVTGIAAANAVLASSGLEPWPIHQPLPPDRLAGLLSRGLWRLRQFLLGRKRSGQAAA